MNEQRFVLDVNVIISAWQCKLVGDDLELRGMLRLVHEVLTISFRYCCRSAS
jgi:hypothetical protein